MSNIDKNDVIQPAVIVPKKKKRWPWLVLLFLLAAAAGAVWYFRLYEQFLPQLAKETAEPAEIQFETRLTPVHEYGAVFDPDQVVVTHNGELTVKSAPDMMKTGWQKAVFTVTLKPADGETMTQDFTVMVNIQDTAAPVITLREEKIELPVGEAFDPESCVKEVSDPVDGPLPYDPEEKAGTWTAVSELDPEEPGSYDVTIIATDQNGLKTQEVSQVTVTGTKKPEATPTPTADPEEETDTTPPVIQLKFLQVEIMQGETYGIDDNIISIADETDGTLPYSDTLAPGTYSVNGGIDVRRSGIYSVTVSAMDKAGNESSTAFTVTVKEAEKTPEPTPVPTPEPQPETPAPTPAPAVNLSGGSAQEQIMNYITGTMGLNRAAACGIVAHMRHESSCNPQAFNPAGYYGLCQWGGGRYENLMNWCGANGLDYTTIAGQLQFMNMELNGAYSGVLSQLQGVADSADGAYDAAWIFGMSYEVSGEYLADLAGQTARSLYGE